ncbi:hypothetical protein ACF068_04350 [Streptomyces sp. NPDC016309]|uniref:hypothetical protein n=1 Tax=Streptomyces sp. NPDC016309 TaxID=3364965 RepID=UPI0036F72E00
MASNCPHCATSAPEGARFCMTCGREIDPVAPPAWATPAPPAPAVPSPPPPPAPYVLGPPPPAGPESPADAADARQGTRGALFWGLVMVAAAVLGGGGTAGVLLLTDRDEAPAPSAGGRPAVVVAPSTPSGGAAPSPSTGSARKPPSTGPAADATPGPSAAPDAGPGASAPAEPAVPEGYRMVADPAGFSFAVPSVWRRVGEEPAGQITYAGSTGMSHLLVGVVHDAPYTSLGNLTALEANSREKNPDYRRVRLEANTFQGRPGAVWEYTYTDRAGRLIHAIDQSYVARDGTEYAVYFTVQDDSWDVARETFDVALSTWRPHDAG